MPLTDTQARKAAAKDKDYKLADANGLHLYVTTKGHKSWRMKYRFGQKERRLMFGPYPEVSLSEARDKRDAARRLLRDDIDPGVQTEKRRAEAAARAAITFEKMARQWHEQQTPIWAPVHAADVINSLERDIFPHIGSTPLSEIDPPGVLEVLRKVEKRGAIETAKRLRQRMSAVFVFAISEGVGSADPAAVVTNALKPLPKKGKQPSLTDPDDAREVLVAAEASGASPVTKLASRLLALTVVRPGVVRGASWGEFEGIDWTGDFIGPQQPLWRVPAARMKLVVERKDEEAFEHLVPLPWQAVDVLRTIRRLTERARYVFPSQRHSHHPLSENAIGYLYNRVGFHGRHVPHGWRAAFSTTMKARARKQRRIEDLDTIERMLAHMPENKVAAAYDRHEHMERRRELGQEWADLLMAGMAPAATLLTGPRR
ncbi:tyrosine-type recombinase/integrase [Sphingomonas abietis]|uniref:Integrase arm-type DNA-binding domain-containing protein n=1 Tax=Sphingomonas abietis TaxID=3012344 RepID=A0ABY7NKD2_9SPHN|nr:integrase arm-type DNA-binding domain-containing protein [Sphingomonas abietis]WBO22000.1 integrase arm-type DNA-binding domain-containing protein [Sphingomonas abietis]